MTRLMRNTLYEQMREFIKLDAVIRKYPKVLDFGEKRK